MKNTIICSAIITLFSFNAFAGGQQIDCESDLSNIRIRATHFSENGEAILRDSSIEYDGYKGTLTGALKITYSHSGEPRYEAETNSVRFIVKIYPDGTFDLLLAGRRYLIDRGSCQLNTVGPF